MSTPDRTEFDLWSALLAGPGGGWLVLGLLSLAGLIAGGWLLARLHPRPAGVSLWQHLRQTRESGVATVEFVLVFPIVMFLALLLLQSTLAMVGNAMVNYAAFTATRAAIVWVPHDTVNLFEPRNTIIPAEGNAKFDRIRAAAVFAVVPISGRLDSSDYPADDFRDGIEDLYSQSGRTPPNWVDTMAAQRVHYAAENTQITLLETQVLGDEVRFDEITGSAQHEFGPRDAISVRVDHRLNLAVPYVRGIFADGEHTTADGPGGYTNVRAQYTLTNEGIDTNLPPLPDLPRSP
jgi:hypothetical protein